LSIELKCKDFSLRAILSFETSGAAHGRYLRPTFAYFIGSERLRGDAVADKNASARNSAAAIFLLRRPPRTVKTRGVRGNRIKKLPPVFGEGDIEI
jgi:hypothetical protein